MDTLRKIIVYLFGIVFWIDTNTVRVEVVPVNWAVGQIFQNLLFSTFLTVGLLERIILKNFFWETYCNLVYQRIAKFDLAWLERKIREKLDEWKFRAPKLLHEWDIPDNLTQWEFQPQDPIEKEQSKSGYYFETSAKKRVISLKQFLFILLVNPTRLPVSIGEYPDLGYELLILDTPMKRFADATVFFFQVDHLPYYDSSGLTTYVNEDMVEHELVVKYCNLLEES